MSLAEAMGESVSCQFGRDVMETCYRERSLAVEATGPIYFGGRCCSRPLLYWERLKDVTH